MAGFDLLFDGVLELLQAILPERTWARITLAVLVLVVLILVVVMLTSD